MGWILRLAETGPDAAAESIDLIEIHRSSGLADIANLGLTLSEAKELLARVQQAMVAAQARDHAVRRPSCASCSGQCHLKDWRPRRIATPFGEVAPRLRRWLCVDCGRTETGIDWPENCRSTPELNELHAHLSALLTYRVAAGVLAHWSRRGADAVLQVRCAIYNGTLGTGFGHLFNPANEPSQQLAMAA